MAVNMPEGRPIYPLNVAAQLVGLSPRTIRGYEEAGIIEPARVGGNRQRLYSEQDLKWLRCIRDMIHDEGLTVTAIRRLLDLIVVYPVEDEHKFSDSKGRILPDAFLMKRGSTPRDLAFMVHTDIGKGFLYAVDARTKMRVKDTHELQDGDIIRIISTAK